MSVIQVDGPWVKLTTSEKYLVIKNKFVNY